MSGYVTGLALGGWKTRTHGLCIYTRKINDRKLSREVTETAMEELELVSEGESLW